MKTQADCFPCALRQALTTARRVTDDPQVLRRIMHETMQRLLACGPELSPAAFSQPAYDIVHAVTGNTDPYGDMKKSSNALAMRILPEVRKVVTASKDPLETALHAAAAGNSIDEGIAHKFDIARDLLTSMQRPFATNDVAAFRKELQPGRSLLYLGDNAGEIVFDALAIEEILKTGMAVTFAVKSNPIINDATLTDAEAVGMTKLVPVIETGSGDIGVNWDHASPAFRDAFTAADVILGKGHGNFETCDQLPGTIYFLLKAKCEIVAAALGCSLYDTVLLHRPGAH